MTQRLAMLFGNGLGAVLLVLVGPAGVFAINGGLFLVSALAHSGMRVPAVAPGDAPVRAERRPVPARLSLPWPSWSGICGRP